MPLEITGGDRDALELRGELVQTTASRAEAELGRRIGRGTRLALDLSGVSRVDAAGIAVLSSLWRRARAAGGELSVVALSPAAEEALRFAPAPSEDVGRRPRGPGLFVRAGDATIAAWDRSVGLATLTVDTLLFSFKSPRRVARVRRGAAAAEAVKIGVDALPIVALIAFLVGTVIALQAAYQLAQFGANIYVANLIAVGMTREMGPLMTAIMIAGRSGAAIAAEIATMKVSQEVDALRAMGLDPVPYIVVPKFRGITLTFPLLVVFANVLGIFGGYIVAALYLDLSSGAFWGQVGSALVVKDVLTGLVKSLAFAWIIVIIAAHRGFQARGGAESVGRVTTESVVASIFWVIVADAVFSLIFYFGG